MEEKENMGAEPFEEDGMPVSEILPDRDILMMEKPLPDNSSSRYRPADKKLLRNIVIIALFLIAALIILMVIVRNFQGGEPMKPLEQPTEIREG